MQRQDRQAHWGSARVSRAGFGVAPKQSFVGCRVASDFDANGKFASAGRARQHARRVRYPDLHGEATVVRVM
jgi:hypothetical protein